MSELMHYQSMYENAKLHIVRLEAEREGER